MALKRTSQGGVALSWSAYSLYRLCPRRFWWAYMQGGTGIVPQRGAINTAALYGVLWHALVRGRYLGRSDDDTVRAVCEERNVSALPTEEVEALAGQARADVAWYMALPGKRELRVRACEREMSMPLAGGRHEMYGIPDLVVHETPERGGAISVVDHKTVQRKPSDADLTRHTNSRQFTWYMLLVAHTLDEACVDGIVNIVRAGASTSKRPLNELLWQAPLLRNEDQLAQLASDVEAACGEIERGVERGIEAFAEGPHACVHWNRACEYLDLCNARRKHWPSMIEHGYQAAEDRPRKTT